MLKYIKDHMATIDNVEIFPLISLVIFMLFFVILIAYVLRTDKKTIDEVSQYPIDHNPEP